MPNRTIDQRLAEAAYAQVSARTSDDKAKRKKYRTFALKFPALIHTCGLAQAVAFAVDNDSDNRYIGAMTFNGQPYDKNYLEHADILRGGVITCQMQSEPNRQRGIYSVPYSFSNSLILWEPYEYQPSFPGGASALLSFLQDKTYVMLQFPANKTLEEWLSYKKKKKKVLQ